MQETRLGRGLINMSEKSFYIPLSKKLLPQTFDSIYGQKHLIGENKILRNLILNDSIVSMVFYGPPGTGKSALAYLISKLTNSKFIKLNAVIHNLKDLREIISNVNEKTILFIDEIHRFNKLQQDALLPLIEEGTIIFIGATTHNPFFYLIPALTSRIQIFKFEKLKKDELKNIFNDTTSYVKKESNITLSFEQEAELLLYDFSNGDARRLINTIELSINSIKNKDKTDYKITKNHLLSLLQTQSVYYDKKDTHYDVISAFIKSVRGSDPDAAIYWLAKGLKAGEDPLFYARRLIILASEDIGNANPHALMLATAAYDAVHCIGMPEARIILAQATVYLSSVPKSNSSYLALLGAENDIEKGLDMDVPLHLKDSNYYSKKRMQHGIGYKYPHDYKNHYVKQTYMPKKKKYYMPLEQGYEINLKKYLKMLEEVGNRMEDFC